MTELIDVSTPQAGINMGQVAAAGVGAVIVKVGGFNVAPMYVAPHYVAQVDAARAAGLKVGHYWVVGNGDPVTEADFFVRSLHGFDASSDVLVLDDERLDSNATFWGDTQAAAFLSRVLTMTGVAAQQVWLYVGAANARSIPWPQVTGLGVRWWVAAYGPNDGTRHATPAGPCDVHQYTSQGRIGGFTVDRSYSTLPLDDLFGGTVPLTQDDYNKIAQAVWRQALGDNAPGGDGTHAAATFLMWASRAHHLPTTAPVGQPLAGVTQQDLINALTDPTVQNAIGATLAKHLPTKLNGTLSIT